ncbi:MAG: FtsX-like permease family protein [Pirellulaceae bacterium]
MFKLLLCSRYLRSRYIALASIISVTLGVATMIVVNSVMSGFQEEMYKRLHGILSDIVVESHGSNGIEDVASLENNIRDILGDDLEGLTTTVHIPSMLTFQVRGQWITKQVNLIGIDDQTYASVSDFSQYLLHPQNRERLSFMLREGGYDKRLRDAGRQYRRMRVAAERYQEEQRKQMELQTTDAALNESLVQDESAEVQTANVPSETDHNVADQDHANELLAGEDFDLDLAMEGGLSLNDINVPDDPFAQLDDAPQHVFDPAKEEWTGIILGISISNIRHRTPEGEVADFFLCRPGDDVKVGFPTAGKKPEIAFADFTVVDFYESKMSEYDSGFAFVPIRRLQELRNMIDPATGEGAVSSIQLKLAEGANLELACQKLREHYPAELFPYRIQTWKEMQGPLLAAVQMETTILNILLFMIIAVAGFGILATFFMIVVEKTKDIGILKSLGASKKGVMSIFLGYGLSLGCVGSGVGMVLGLLFVVNINSIASLLESFTGREVFDPTIYYFQQIPTVIEPWTIGWIVLGAMLIAVMASVLPALRAARMHPVEALRYE